jgi:membrane-bound lytic murein transglycosylase F
MRGVFTRVLLGALLTAFAPRAEAQPRAAADRYDEAFRKAAKRQFGPAFDWRVFKAQGMAESNIDPTARSGVGARGVMQLMPTTFREIASKNPELTRIDDAESNIAAGIAYDRVLWRSWAQDSVDADRLPFMLASYNAGRGTLLQAQKRARAERLDPRIWPSIEQVAPTVPRWRHAETLGYVRRITALQAGLDDRGRVTAGGVSVRGKR